MPYVCEREIFSFKFVMCAVGDCCTLYEFKKASADLTDFS